MDYFDQQTERLKFRKLTEEDVAAWTTFFVDNDRLKYLGIDLSKSAETLARDWIAKQMERYQSQGFGHLAVELKSTQEFIGMGGILPRILNEQEEYEIAYSLIPKYWKNGYGTEIAKQLKAYGLSKIQSERLISIIDKENKDSIKIAVKNGMSVLRETTFLGMEVFVFGIDNAPSPTK